MENSNKPSSSSMQDAQSPKKKNLAKKISPKKSLAKNPKKTPLLKLKAAKKSITSSEEKMKTRATSNRASLDSLMAGFQSEERAKTALGMPLKDFSESAVALLMSNYKVENEKVLSTTALAM